MKATSTLTAVENTTGSGDSYTEEDLTAMTIAQIKALAEEKGYTITATRKADIIAEFLAQQG